MCVRICVWADLCVCVSTCVTVVQGVEESFSNWKVASLILHSSLPVCKCPPSYFINELLFSLNGEILNNPITCNSIKTLFDCIYSDMAMECNEHIQKFLKRQINFRNSTACSGFHCTKMYHSQKSARLCIQSVRQSMLGCGVWCSQYMQGSYGHEKPGKVMEF